MKLIRHGTFRLVLLAGRLAIKMPRLWPWRCLLHGLLSNMNERLWKDYEDNRRLCPVLWCVWGGWLLVMRRAESLPADTEIDWSMFDGLPCDRKLENVGLFEGRRVLLDYG